MAQGRALGVFGRKTSYKVSDLTENTPARAVNAYRKASGKGKGRVGRRKCDTKCFRERERERERESVV